MPETFKADSCISHYRIVSKIGAGGMGEVYLAQDTKLDRKVAIKFLNEEFSQDANKLKRFIQEAKAASALNHPNILTVYEIGDVDGKNYIATELIDGQTLREHLSLKESLSLNPVLKIGVQVAEALSAAHHAGIIHREVKRMLPAEAVAGARDDRDPPAEAQVRHCSSSPASARMAGTVQWYHGAARASPAARRWWGQGGLSLTTAYRGALSGSWSVKGGPKRNAHHRSPLETV